MVTDLNGMLVRAADIEVLAEDALRADLDGHAVRLDDCAIRDVCTWADGHVSADHCRRRDVAVGSTLGRCLHVRSARASPIGFTPPDPVPFVARRITSLSVHACRDCARRVSDVGIAQEFLPADETCCSPGQERGAGDWSIDDDEMRYLISILTRISDRDDRTDVVTDEHDWLGHAKVYAQELADVFRHRALVISARGFRGPAGSTVVRCGETEPSVGQQWNDTPPLVRCLWEPMQKRRSRRSLTSFDVMQSDTW